MTCRPARERIKAWPARGRGWTLVIIILILCAHSNNGQGWKQQSYPNVTNVDFGSVAWSTPTTCVLAGVVGSYSASNAAGGAMIRSTSAGTKWTTVFSDAAAPIYDVAATFAASPTSTPPCYVAVSKSGAIYVSRDNGASFALGQTLPNVQLNGVAVGSPTGNAYTVGVSQLLPYSARIYRAVQWQQNSCSATFADVTPSGASNPSLVDVASFDDKTVIAVGYKGYIVRSNSSGATWSQVASGVTENNLQCVSVGNATVALAAGDGGTMLRTINGGNTWTLVTFSSALLLPTGASFRFHALSMAGPTTAYAAASPFDGISGPGVIIRTLDGGKTWALQFSAAQTGQSILGLAMMNSFIGVAGFSRSLTAGGPTAIAVKTMDTPTGQPSGQPTTQPSAQPSLRPTNWPTGYTAPTPYNVAWNAVPTGAGSAVFTSAAWASSGACAFLAGSQSSSGVLLQSCDGGATWTAVAPITTYSFALVYTDVASYGNATAGYVIAVTNAGYVYVSSNQGQTWANPLATPSSLGGATVGANGAAFVVGGRSAYSKYFYTSSAATGFTQWAEVTPRSLANTTLQFNGVSTYDGVNVIAVGNAGLVYYSSNAGQSWGSALTGAGDLSSVSSGSSLVAFAGAATLWKTSDGGVTWAALAAATKLLAANDAFRFHSVSTMSRDVVYAASSSGLLLRSVTGGATFTVESALTPPGAFSITQSHCLSMFNDRKPGDRGARGLSGDDGGVAYVKSFAPTPAPTRKPLQPTDTRYPSFVPTPAPSASPSTAAPATPRPSTPRPSAGPTYRPSSPSGQPTRQPTAQPTEQPTEQPTGQPAGWPTMQPSGQPTSNPSAFSLYTYKLPGVPFAQSPSWVQPPPLPLTTVDFVASAWSPAGVGGSLLPTCVMVGYNDNFGGMVRSTNGGGFWSTLAPSINTGLSTRMADVAASPAPRGGLGSGSFIAVSLSGDIYVSSNNGASFVTPGTVPARLQGVAIGVNGYAYAVGLSTAQRVGIYRATAVNAFSSWTACNVANAPANLLTAVTTRDGVSVIAVGTSGTVLYSANNGTTWVPGTSGVTKTLQCVSAANAAVAMAAGDGGTLLLTTNGGQTWADVAGGLSAAAKAALGASPSYHFHTVTMVSASAAFVASSSGVILRTLNRGAFWAVDYISSDASSTSPTIVSLSMANGYTGVAGYARDASGIGGRVVARTLDSPTSQPTARPTGQPTGQPSARPTTHPTGYDYTDALSESGVGGVVWNAVATSTSNLLVGAAWGGNASALVAVGSQSYNGVILLSADGGYTWTTKIDTGGLPFQYTGVAYYPGPPTAGRGAFLVTSSIGRVLLSADGRTWTTVFQTSTSSKLTGVAVGANGLAYAVSDGGDIFRANASVGFAAWPPVSTANGLPPSGVALQAVSTFDGVNAIALSKDGRAFYTLNAGETWAGGGAVLASALAVISHGSSLVAFAGGPAGSFLRSRDGGQTWQSLADPNSRGASSLATVLGLQSFASTGFLAISALSPSIVYAGTTAGAVVRSVNGGATFTLERPADNAGIKALAMFTNNRRFAPSRGLLGVAVNSVGNVLVKALTPSAAPTPLPSSTYTYVWLPSSTGNAANVAVAGAWGGGRFNPVLVGYRPTTTTTTTTTTSASTVGFIVASQDGGLTWAPAAYTRAAAALVGSFAAPWRVNDVASFTDAKGNTTFLAALSPGLVLTSTNTQGAANWAVAANVTTMALAGAAIASGNGVAVVVASNVASSRRTVFMSTYPSPTAFAAAAQQLNATDPRAAVYRNWTNISPTAAAGLQFTAVALAADASTAIAVGLGGTVYVATCAAAAGASAGKPAPTAACLRASWAKAATGTTADMYCVSVGAGSASAPAVAVAGGSSATVLRTADGGKTWISLTTTIIAQLGGTLSVMNNVRFHSCTMLSAQVFYFAATNGVVVKTADGGATFSLDTSIRSPLTAGAAPVSCLSMYTGADALARGIVAGVAGDAGGYAYTKYVAPSSAPTYEPTLKPLSPTDSRYPTTAPTSAPTQRPTLAPTSTPTYRPTGRPSSQPSRQPTRQPTGRPSLQPTAHPSRPTGQPSARPSNPSSQPTEQPTRQPTEQPTRQPTSQPSEQPTSRPTGPSGQPTSRPTHPTGQPTARPSRKPTPVGFTYQPTRPTSQPSSEPPSRTRPPIKEPSRLPSRAPSATPTMAPPPAPTATPAPTVEPTIPPSTRPTLTPSPMPVATSATPSASPSVVLVQLIVTDHRIDGIDLATGQSAAFAAALQRAVAAALTVTAGSVAVVAVNGSPTTAGNVAIGAAPARRRRRQLQASAGTVYATYTALIPQSAVQANENALGAAVASGQFTASLQKSGFPNALSTVRPTNFAVVAVGATAAPSSAVASAPTAPSALSGGAVAGIVIGVLAGVAGVAAAVYCCALRRPWAVRDVRGRPSQAYVEDFRDFELI